MEQSNESNTANVEEYKCDLCGETFNTATELEEHKHRHGRPALGHDDDQREVRGDIGAAGLPTSPIR